MNRIFVRTTLAEQINPGSRAVTRYCRVLTPNRGARARSDLLLPKSLHSNPGPDQRIFFFDIDNCLYPKSSGIPALMKDRIENYFKASGIPHSEVESLAHHYYLTYGLAIRGLVERHPEVDIRDYDEKVDGALPLESILKEDPALRRMVQSMNIGRKWLFTNAGESHANRVVRILGLQGLFHGITFCDYRTPQFVCKPDRKSFEKAMKEAGVTDPSLCFFVDDSSANVEMATKVGWTAVHVLEDPAEDSSSGRFRIHSITDLPQVMPELWKSSKK